MNKEYVLNKLQQLQVMFLDDVDINVSTRKDLQAICVHVCGYTYDMENKKCLETSKLYVEKFLYSDTSEIIELKLKRIKEIILKLYAYFALKNTNESKKDNTKQEL